MIITISGQAGSGKSTVARLLAEKLGYKHYSMGDLRRKMARERGMTIAEFNKLGEKEDFTDKDVDNYQKQLGEKEDNFVVDGRLSFHFIPQSFKVYVKATLAERAKRVFKDERDTEHFSSEDDAQKALEWREKTDIKRYQHYYHIDPSDHGQYDLVVDSSTIPASQVVKKILSFIKQET